MLSFNLSVAGEKEFLKEIDYPCQIMPQTRAYLTRGIVESYPKTPEAARGGCIHVSYITRCFNEDFLNESSRARVNVELYLELADRLGVPFVLIHGPENYREFEMLNSCLNILKELHKNTKAKIIIEIPAFKGIFVENVKKSPLIVENDTPRGFVVDYLNQITEAGFNIVLDSAHLYANGCEVPEIIALFKYYADKMQICHLNGNKRRKFTADAHIPIFYENSLKNVKPLLEYLSKSNLLCIAENTTEKADFKKWQEFAAANGFKIAPFNERFAY